MKRRPTLDRLLCVVALAALAGCSSQQVYGSALQWQRQACQKIDDRAERTRCERDVSLSYDSYREQADSLRKP